MSDQPTMVSDVVAGVPYVALPPAGWHAGQETAPLVIAWHLNDPPRSAAAMAAALPLAGVAAWRVYLDLPMHGRRQLPGGLGDFMRLGYQDAVLEAFEPQVTQAVDEFPSVLAGLRARLPVSGGPIAVVGASVGALPAQLVLAGDAAQVSAARMLTSVAASSPRPWNDRIASAPYRVVCGPGTGWMPSWGNHGCCRRVARVAQAMEARSARQSAPGWAGSSISPITVSTISSKSWFLSEKYQYSEVGAEPTRSAMRRIDTAARPSRSASSMAARVIWSRLKAGAGGRAGAGRSQIEPASEPGGLRGMPASPPMRALRRPGPPRVDSPTV